MSQRIALATITLGLAVLAQAASVEQRPPPRHVTVSWEIAPAPEAKAERIQRGLDRRGVRELRVPPLPPLRVWPQPDGSEAIAHEPPEAGERSGPGAGEAPERPE